MPAFDATSELLAGIEYAVEPLLVVHWSRDTISSHPLCEVRQLVGRVVLEPDGGRRGVAHGGLGLVGGHFEVVELVFRWAALAHRCVRIVSLSIKPAQLGPHAHLLP